MYLEYHYVIAVILLSALIAGLLVRWRYRKQITQILWCGYHTCNGETINRS